MTPKEPFRLRTIHDQEDSSELLLSSIPSGGQSGDRFHVVVLPVPAARKAATRDGDGITRAKIVAEARELGTTDDGSFNPPTQAAVAEALGVTDRYLRKFGRWMEILREARN